MIRYLSLIRFRRILKKCFIVTACVVSWGLQSHSSVSAILRGFMTSHTPLCEWRAESADTIYHCACSTASTEEILRLLKKCFFSITCTVICLACSNLHISVLYTAKGLIVITNYVSITSKIRNYCVIIWNIILQWWTHDISHDYIYFKFFRDG